MLHRLRCGGKLPSISNRAPAGRNGSSGCCSLGGTAPSCAPLSAAGTESFARHRASVRPAVRIRPDAPCASSRPLPSHRTASLPPEGVAPSGTGFTLKSESFFGKSFIDPFVFRWFVSSYYFPLRQPPGRHRSVPHPHCRKNISGGGLLLPAEPARFPVRRATDTPAPAGTPSAVGPANEAAFRHSYLRPSRQIRTRRECADSTKNIECLFPAPAGRTGRDGTAHGPSKTVSRGGEGRPGELRAARSSALPRPPKRLSGRRAVPPPAKPERDGRRGFIGNAHRN